MIYPEGSLLSSKCSNPKCDNTIEIQYSKFKGGDNDSVFITYVCDKCETEGDNVIKNIETLSINGGKLKNYKCLD